nr:TIGR04149 family rSAM-modified RiPP [Pedobacter sp. ASV2]
MKNQKKLSKAEMKNVLGGYDSPLPQIKCTCGDFTTYVYTLEGCLAMCANQTT